MKYSLKQVVFYIENNKIHSAPILSRMCIENVFSDNECVTKEQKDSFQHFGSNQVVYATCHGIYDENQLYASKEELIATL